MTTRCIFPAELISYILYYTDPRDIVQWQTVSKWFRTITNDAMLWKTLYANAPFPCPSGPFPSQSTESLQRTLVKSAQLAQSWTTWSMRDLSTTKVHLKGDPSTPPKLICGRWLLSCESNRRFVLYDVYADVKTHARQVLWKKRKPVVSSWDVCGMTTVEGRCVVYVVVQFSSEYRKRNSPLWQLLEFRLDDRGELCESATVDPPSGFPSLAKVTVELHGGKSPFLHILASCVCMVFDTRTRVFYNLLPEFRIALDETRREVSPYRFPRRYRLAFTETHLIAFCYLYNHMDHIAVVKVFTLPPDGFPVEKDNNDPVFRPTHEGVLDFRVMNVEALEPSVDPVSGATIVRLLDCYARCHDPQVTRLDLTLPEPSAVDVLPLTVKLQHIGFPKGGAPATHYLACFQYVDVSNDGQVRGFFRGIPRQGFLETDNDHMMKFTIDTTQDPWVTTCGKLSPADWSHIEDGWVGEIMTFDGMRGKLCFADQRNYKTIVVVDIE